MSTPTADHGAPASPRPTKARAARLGWGVFWAAVIGWPLVWFPDLPWARGDLIHLGALQGMVAGLLVALGVLVASGDPRWRMPAAVRWLAIIIGVAVCVLIAAATVMGWSMWVEARWQANGFALPFWNCGRYQFNCQPDPLRHARDLGRIGQAVLAWFAAGRLLRLVWPRLADH